MNDFFSQAGAFVGHILKSIIDFFHQFIGSIGGAFHGFLSGLGESLGINHSITGIIVVVIGIVLLIKGIGNLRRQRFISGILALVVSISLLGWIIG
ncbi:hypothetical protein [Cernens ardua]|uniref:hypothetical protein n=1 Tax=Cernens ardua TaxID=3402176 RepID=UPI003F9CCDA6